MSNLTSRLSPIRQSVAVLVVLFAILLPNSNAVLAQTEAPNPGINKDRIEAGNTITPVPQPVDGEIPPQDSSPDVEPVVSPNITYTYERVCLQGVANNLDRWDCVRINAICNAEDNGVLVEWIAIDSTTSPPTESRTGSRSCLYPGTSPEPPGGGEVVEPEVIVTLEDFQSQPILAAEIVSEPASFGLLGGHNNVYANVDEQEFTFDLLGDEVQIRAWPVGYDWNYGDGNTRTTQTAGTSVPEVDWLFVETPTSHEYADTGDYNLVLTTRFAGDYSVNGGPWLPIAGEATVQSEPHLMSIWRSDTRLVDGTCDENPNAWGCG
ncbi:hypothetical protein [Arthrobacter sp. H5]|uniref:hypothetical protein n=1 Tax=Arthrobacter sp. H5 TaxID=1267973 RepID=UPI0012DD46BA|nr:hypothetical protein [Arthrobacter sp. H5]